MPVSRLSENFIFALAALFAMTAGVATVGSGPSKKVKFHAAETPESAAGSLLMREKVVCAGRSAGMLRGAAVRCGGAARRPHHDRTDSDSASELVTNFVQS